MNNTCIITGATGWIGSHLTRHLLSKGWKVHVIADPAFGYRNIGDILQQVDIFEYKGDVRALCGYFREVRADVVFHLAAAVITNPDTDQIPVLVKSNVQFGTEILHAMKESGTSNIVSTGSCWQNYNSDSYNPVDLYAATKEAFEAIARLYTDAFGFRHINLRLFDVYGENDPRPKLWNLLKKIAGTDEHLAVSPGEQLLDLVHVSDVCTAYECAAGLVLSSAPGTSKVFGVRTGRTVSLREAVALLEKSIGKRILADFGARPYKSREVMKPCDAYAWLPGWKAAVSLEEGFQRFKD